MSSELLKEYKIKLTKALGHLEYSLNKIENYSFETPLSEETLETLESFTARMARVSDIFLSKYLRLLVKHEDPAFDGSIRDLCNFAEKKGYINSADLWMQIRTIRNTTAHEYEEEDLKNFFIQSKSLASVVVETLKKHL